MMIAISYLFKAHVLRILAEALTAHVQAVFTNDAPLIRANAAAAKSNSSERFHESDRGYMQARNVMF
jgi:hypothetical protein